MIYARCASCAYFFKRFVNYLHTVHAGEPNSGKRVLIHPDNSDFNRKRSFDTPRLGLLLFLLLPAVFFSLIPPRQTFISI